MKILVVGGGGREHAIVWALKKSIRVEKIWCAPGNGGIAALAECVPLKATDLAGITDFAVKNRVDFVVVAPDDPLALGLVDELTKVGILAFGPRQNAAIIESSKIFSKNLMKKYGIPTAEFETFDQMEEALAYVSRKGAPIVVKADGLALGKGVVVAETVEEAEEAVRSCMEGHAFGASGSRLVIEEKMTGPEVTVLCFADGKTLLPMPASRDHKRAYDGNRGPNTGGMGAISPVPDFTPELLERCKKEIFLPTIRAMEAEGRPFQGVIYFGLMLTPAGPKVIEYNARFGDPEAQAVLSLLESDLLDILEACCRGSLDHVNARWSEGSSCCVVMASGGYPRGYRTGYPIHGLDAAQEKATVFHAGTKRSEDGEILTAGGRVLGVTATAPGLDAAITRAYEAVDKISFQDMEFRRDIGRS
jgi:phosphoribosylamine--glycine ligase